MAEFERTTSEVKNQTQQIARNLNHIEHSLSYILTRIGYIENKIAESGRDTDIIEKFRLEYEALENDKLSYEFRRDRLIMELSNWSFDLAVI